MGFLKFSINVIHSEDLAELLEKEKVEPGKEMKIVLPP
jgi:hypothetical protein